MDHHLQLFATQNDDCLAAANAKHPLSSWAAGQS